MADSYSVEAVLKAVDANFTSTMEQAVQSLGEVVRANSSMNNQIASSGNASATASSRLTSGFKEMAGALGLVAVGAKAFQVVSNSIGSAISRIDTLNNATRTFTNMGFNTKQISSAMDGLKASIQGLPTPLNEAVQGVQMIAASTGDLGKSQQVYSALNDAIIGFGGNTNDVSNAIVQLSQAFANGKIDAQTWNSMMQSNLGPTLNAVAKKMGMTTAQLKDGLSTGKISVADFQNALIDLDKNGGGGLKSLHKIALDSTSGISTAIANAKTAITRGVADMIDNINKGLSSSGFPTIAQMITSVGSVAEQALSRIGTAIPMVMAVFSPLLKMISSLAKNDVFKLMAVSVTGFIGAMAGISRSITVFNELKNAIMVIKVAASVAKDVDLLKFALTNMAGESKIAAAAAKILNAVMSVNPWVLLAAAIAAVVAGLVYFFTQTKTGRALWSGFVSFLSGLWQQLVTTATTVWNNIVTVFTTAVSIIKGIWSGISTFFSTIWNAIVTVASATWQGIVTVVTTVVTQIKSVWQGIVAFFTTLWTGIVTVATTIWSMIVAVVTTVVAAVQAAWSGFSAFMSALWSGIVAVTSAVWNGIVSVISAVWSTITSVISGAVSAVRSVTSAGFNAARTAVSTVMNAMKAVISTIWNDIKSLFRAGVNFIKSVVHVDLSAQGRAIMQSFFNGLKSVWNGIKSFVSGIAGWIKSHKGPISYDAKLLIPAGQAIMQGLNNGLIAGFTQVQSNVSSMAERITQAAMVEVPKANTSAVSASLNALDSQMQNSSMLVKGRLSTNNTITAGSRLFEGQITELVQKAITKLDNVDQHPVVDFDTAQRMRGWMNKENAHTYLSYRG